MSVIISGTGVIGPNGSASGPTFEGADTDTGIFFPAAGAVAISTDGVESLRVSGNNMAVGTSNTSSARMRVDTTGGGGYGRDSPNLWLSNSNDPSIRLFNTGNSRSATMYVPGGGGGWALTCETNTAFDLSTDTSGNFTARGNVTAFSDARLKTDVRNIQNALDTVMKMQGVHYTRIDNGEKNIGFIAQELQQCIPEVVSTTLDGNTLGVSYGNLVALLVEAIKEQQQQIESLKNIISSNRVG